MSDNKMHLDDDQLDEVVGGLFRWHKKSLVMDYTHSDGTVTKHKILDYAQAWERSNILHSQHMDEDQILQDLIAKGYIQG